MASRQNHQRGPRCPDRLERKSGVYKYSSNEAQNRTEGQSIPTTAKILSPPPPRQHTGPRHTKGIDCSVSAEDIHREGGTDRAASQRKSERRGCSGRIARTHARTAADGAASMGGRVRPGVTYLQGQKAPSHTE